MAFLFAEKIVTVLVVKRFDAWNQLKKILEIKSVDDRLFFHERQVWFLKMGENIGSEQSGKGKQFLRPVVILKKFNEDVFWGIPCTGSYKEGPFYLQTGSILERPNSLILSQLRLLDARRLSYRIGYFPKPEFAQLKKKLTEMIQ